MSVGEASGDWGEEGWGKKATTAGGGREEEETLFLLLFLLQQQQQQQQKQKQKQKQQQATASPCILRSHRGAPLNGAFGMTDRSSRWDPDPATFLL